jgi:hypothetical protein
MRHKVKGLELSTYVRLSIILQLRVSGVSRPKEAILT